MKKWEILHKTKNIKHITNEQIIEVLLNNRGIVTAKDKDSFLHSSLDSITAKAIGVDEYEIKKALARIGKAIEQKESVVVYTDYDADGVCSGAIMWETLNDLGARVMPYVPHRVDEGYGLSQKGIDRIVNTHKVKLIVTVDHGVSAQSAIEYARKKGIDTIIIDHHLPSDKLPTCEACVHTTSLCAGGLTWFTARELYKKFGAKISHWEEKVREFLELASIATVADLVPLKDANRTIVKYGLSEINQTKRLGLKALLREAGLRIGKIGTYEIGRMIAPRINAMGRIVHALDALRLLCTKDTDKADTLAKLLCEVNTQRQQLTQEASAQAFMLVNEEKIIFVAHKNFNQGVIGLVAGKLVEKYYRPAVVISLSEQYAKASARSVPGYNIVDALKSTSNILESVGGHPMAAGFTVEASKLDTLKEMLLAHANKNLTDDLLIKTIRADLEVPIGVVTLALFNALSDLSPFGVGNPEPTFVSRNIDILAAGVVGKDGTHLKLKLRQPTAQGGDSIVDAIGFGLGEIYETLSSKVPIDIVYGVSTNEWNGKTSLQLKLKDVRVPVVMK